MSNITKFEDRVKERLKDIIADLIPDDQYDALVKQAVAEFRQKELPDLVKSMLKDHFKAKINDVFAEPEWQTKWNDTGSEVASDMVKKMIIDMAPDIIANMVGGTVQRAIYALRSQGGY